MSTWPRGAGAGGSVNVNPANETKITVPAQKLRYGSGLPPNGGIACFSGSAKIHKFDAVYEEIWKRLVQPEKDRHPQKKGYGVLIKVERAEDFDGKPLDIS